MYSLFGAIGGHDWILVLNLADFCLSKGQGTGIVGAFFIVTSIWLMLVTLVFPAAFRERIYN